MWRSSTHGPTSREPSTATSPLRAESIALRCAAVPQRPCGNKSCRRPQRLPRKRTTWPRLAAGTLRPPRTIRSPRTAVPCRGTRRNWPHARPLRTGRPRAVPTRQSSLRLRRCAQTARVQKPRSPAGIRPPPRATAPPRPPQSVPGDGVPGQISDPYLPQALAEGEYFERPGIPASELSLDHLRQQREYIDRATGREIAWDRPLPPTAQAEDRLRSRDFVGEDELESRHWNGVESVAPAQASHPPPSGSQAVPRAYERPTRPAYEPQPRNGAAPQEGGRFQP